MEIWLSRSAAVVAVGAAAFAIALAVAPAQWRGVEAQTLSPLATSTAVFTATPTPTPSFIPISFGSRSISDQTWTVGEQIANLHLPESTGGTGAPQYTLSPSLPASAERRRRISITSTERQAPPSPRRSSPGPPPIRTASPSA